MGKYENQVLVYAVWMITYLGSVSATFATYMNEAIAGQTLEQTLTRSRLECATFCDISDVCVAFSTTDSSPFLCKMYSIGHYNQNYPAVGSSVSKKKVPCPPTLTYNAMFRGCLRLILDDVSWDVANVTCTALDSRVHLVAITDRDKQLALNALAASAGVTGIYTSGHAVSPGSPTFTWSHSGEALSYTNWRAGNPDIGRQDCLLSHYKRGAWEWVDRKCDDTFAFVCEF